MRTNTIPISWARFTKNKFPKIAIFGEDNAFLVYTLRQNINVCKTRHGFSHIKHVMTIHAQGFDYA